MENIKLEANTHRNVVVKGEYSNLGLSNILDADLRVESTKHVHDGGVKVCWSLLFRGGLFAQLFAQTKSWKEKKLAKLRHYPKMVTTNTDDKYY